MARISKDAARRVRHERLRRHVAGTADRPRLMVRRTLHHIYAMLVDDSRGHTLVMASTRDKDVAGGVSSHSNVGAAKAVGTAIAAKAKAAGVTSVVFDRGGYKYHGRIAALADAAREAGLEF